MKRKSKLFFSIASMMFAVALLCFGVYAALSVTYTISGSVVYQVQDVFVNIQTSVYVSTLGTLTDETLLRTNMTKFQNGETVTDTAKTSYEHIFETYKNGDITQQGDVTSEASGIKINYGSYKIENQGQENEYAQGFAYYIVVNIKNYGTEQVGVSVQNNINAQNINSKVAVTKSTNIDARGESAFAEKNIVIALALDDATKSVSNVTFSLPITISKTLVDEYTITETATGKTYNIASDEIQTYTANIEQFNGMNVAMYNFTLSKQLPEKSGQLQNTKWLNLGFNFNKQTTGAFVVQGHQTDIMTAIAGQVPDSIGRMAASYEGYMPIMLGDETEFCLIIGEIESDDLDNTIDVSINYSEIGDIKTLQDLEYIGTTYYGIWLYNLYGEYPLIEDVLSLNQVIDRDENYANNFGSSVQIPNDAKIIGDWAFYYCNNIETITIPSSVEEIGNGSFAISSIKEVIFEENSNLKFIGLSAFEGSALESIILPEGLERIDKHAFEQCYFLTEINIPSTVKILHGGSFASTDIKTITIDSQIVYNECNKFNSSSYNFLNAATTIKIPQSFATDSHEFINSTNFPTISKQDGYVIYQRTI